MYDETYIGTDDLVISSFDFLKNTHWKIIVIGHKRIGIYEINLNTMKLSRVSLQKFEIVSLNRKGALNPSSDIFVFNFKNDYLEVYSINYTDF
jgi:hypothetical protein